MGRTTEAEFEVGRGQSCPGDVKRLIATVPEWFGREESNAQYVSDADSLDTWTVRSNLGEVLGVALVKRHFQETAEIHLIVVDRAHHGEGIGSALLLGIEKDLRAVGVRLLEVKTLGPSDPNPEYARTRRFYEGRGFLPLEETEIWGAGTPCLIMVKPLSD